MNAACSPCIERSYALALIFYLWLFFIPASYVQGKGTRFESVELSSSAYDSTVQYSAAHAGQSPTLDLIADTHFSLIDFNLTFVENQITSMPKPFFVILKLYCEWVEEVKSTQVDISWITVDWPAQDIRREALWSSIVKSLYIESVQVSSGEYVQIDVTDVVEKLLRSCNGFQATLCSHFTLKLSTPTWKWVKFSSSRFWVQERRPQLQLLHSNRLGFDNIAKTDAGYIIQQSTPEKSNAATLDIISNTHFAFIEFDIASLILVPGRSSIRTYIQLYVEWSEAPGSPVSCHLISTGNSIEKGITPAQVVASPSLFLLGTEKAYTRKFIIFDVTDALEAIGTINDKKLQLRISTKTFRWVKLASRKAIKMDHRPAILQGDEPLSLWKTTSSCLQSTTDFIIFFISPFNTSIIVTFSLLTMYYIHQMYRMCLRSFHRFTSMRDIENTRERLVNSSTANDYRCLSYSPKILF